VLIAYGLQGLVTIAAGVSCVWIWRQQSDIRLKGASLLIGALLSTPYVLDYDFVVFGMALALLTSYGLDHGFFPWEKTVIALSWVLPSLARGLAKTFGLPVGLLLLTVILGFVLAHARAEKRRLVCCRTFNPST
jgi:hypothetical protein